MALEKGGRMTMIGDEVREEAGSHIRTALRASTLKVFSEVTWELAPKKRMTAFNQQLMVNNE